MSVCSEKFSCPSHGTQLGRKSRPKEAALPLTRIWGARSSAKRRFPDDYCGDPLGVHVVENEGAINTAVRPQRHLLLALCSLPFDASARSRFESFTVREVTERLLRCGLVIHYLAPCLCKICVSVLRGCVFVLFLNMKKNWGKLLPATAAPKNKT